VEIDGPGADQLTVRRDDGAGDFRIFTSVADITLNDMTISNGVADFGGGILVQAFLQMNRCVVSGNTATANGGGIDTIPDAVTSLTITDSAIIGNTAASQGGGIHYTGDDLAIVIETTVSGNTAPGGAGIAVTAFSGFSPFLLICDSIITDNTGIGVLPFVVSGNSAARLQSTIVAGNETDLAVAGGGIFFSNGHNLIGDNTGVEAVFPAGLPNGNSDLVGTAASPVDPLLLPLADNGGTTPTHALGCGSPAIDTGETFNSTLDQRGQTRFADGDGDGTATEDIGSFELLRYPVTTLADAGAGSLRQGILDNNLAGGGPTPTMALELDSPAVDAGQSFAARGISIFLTLPDVDQRGRARTQDGDCDAVETIDIGAYELDDCRGGNVNAAGLKLVFADDMESGSGNFTTSSPTSNGDWAIIATPNACSPGNAWFSSDIDSIKDDDLDTVPILLPTGCSTLKFNHTYITEADFDGCVIEISVDGSSFTDLGDRILQGGYNSVISTGFGSPIAGREAWSGAGTSCEEVVVDLGGFGGSQIVVRFRMACDSSVSDEGWYVDDVDICELGGETITDVLFINGSAGVGVERRVTIGTGDPISIDLLTSPAGPLTNAKYFMYVWFGDSSNPAIFRASGIDFGVLVNPGPLQAGGPKPFRCLRGTGIPPVVCNGVQELPAPPRAPFAVNRGSGLTNPLKFTFQALIEDFGSGNALPFSVTNAVILDVQLP
jgi:hypothetical protein